jgi:hypothetical protein
MGDSTNADNVRRIEETRIFMSNLRDSAACGTSPTPNPTTRTPTPAPFQAPTPAPFQAPPPIQAPTSAPSFCFSGDSSVQVLDKGLIAMKDLKVKDLVYVGNHGKQSHYQEVYAFGHWNPSAMVAYLQIYTQGSSNPLEISSAHLLFVHGKKDAVRADMIRPGDYLLKKTKEEPTESLIEVTKITTITKKGAYMPLTKDGTIVVNNIDASSYVSIMESAPNVVHKFLQFISEETLLHWWTTPYRMVCPLTNLCENDYDKDGIAHWLSLGKYVAVTGDQWWTGGQMIGVALFMIFMLFFVAVEKFLDHPWIAGIMFLGVLVKTKRDQAMEGKKKNNNKNKLA